MKTIIHINDQFLRCKNWNFIPNVWPGSELKNSLEFLINSYAFVMQNLRIKNQISNSLSALPLSRSCYLIIQLSLKVLQRLRRLCRKYRAVNYPMTRFNLQCAENVISSLFYSLSIFYLLFHRRQNGDLVSIKK